MTSRVCIASKLVHRQYGGVVAPSSVVQRRNPVQLILENIDRQRMTIPTARYVLQRNHQSARPSLSSKRTKRKVLQERDHGYGASVSRGVPVYAPAFAGTHRADTRSDNQAGWLVIYENSSPARKESSIQVRRKATTLIGHSELTIRPYTPSPKQKLFYVYVVARTVQSCLCISNV